MKLTTANIALAAPGQTLRDDAVTGLQLKIGAAKKSFHLYYRTGGRLERRPKIGEYPRMTIGQARTVAKQMLAKIALGEDPSGERKALRAAPTVAQLAQRYKAEYLPRKKPGTRSHSIYNLDKHILPAIGALRVSAVDHEHMERLHARIGKITPIAANRALATASKMFALAEKWKLRPPGTNPCRYVERYPEKSRRRYLTPDEARRIAMALAELRERNRLAVDFILLLLLTGARKGELAVTRWEHYHGNRIELPRELVKNSARTIFLSPHAQAIIEALPRIKDRTILQIKDPRPTWIEARKMSGVENIRMHDLRHSFASVLLDNGYNLEQIGQLLGHTQAQTTRRYAHLMDEKAIEAANKAGGQLVEWMKQG